MQIGIKESVIQEIKDIAKRNGITKVILFGSRARGDYHRTSDIDLAVIGSDIAKFTLDVKEETETLLDFDIVDLNTDLETCFHQTIIREGVVLYEEV